MDFGSEDNKWRRDVKHFEHVYNKLGQLQKKNEIVNITKRNFSIIWQSHYDWSYIKALDDQKEFHPQFVCRVCNEHYQKISVVRKKYNSALVNPKNIIPTNDKDKLVQKSTIDGHAHSKLHEIALGSSASPSDMNIVDIATTEAKLGIPITTHPFWVANVREFGGMDCQKSCTASK